MAKIRYIALDVMRGLTLAMMILVNTPGSWSDVYPLLLHADWHGATPTDMVFPFFLFIVGSAMVFSQKSMAMLSPTQQYTKIIKRTLILFSIGILLNAYPFQSEFENLRIMGVLQRIALAYCIAALIIQLPFRFRILTSLTILIIYSVLYYIFSADYSVENNLVREIDLHLLGASHLWQGKGVAFDPEGLLSTLPAAVNVIAGFELARLLIESKSPRKIKTGIFFFAIAMIVFALILNQWIPINKSLWTASFVFLTTGIAALVLLTLVAIETLPGTGMIMKPLSIYGQNPLFIYVLSWLWVASYPLIVFSGDNLHTHLYSAFLTTLNPINASLAFALFHLVLFWGIAYLLHRRRIIISI
jgi:predicted acyltransferase